jgi:acyl-CoA synthetase (AMP-forming)/AMP-acid ligase II
MSGYWNNPQATAEAFAGGWFHSGDLVRMDSDGYVWVVDRKKDMIISGGENIYCAEVENVLASHPSIVEVAVIGRAHEKWGEVPIAVAAVAGDNLALEELDEFLTERLARYKHPKALEIVDALPRNPAGKVLKTEMRFTPDWPSGTFLWSPLLLASREPMVTHVESGRGGGIPSRLAARGRGVLHDPPRRREARGDGARGQR